ncbi:MAG: S16 family serine protease [Verrucomicrobiota bacterium]
MRFLPWGVFFLSVQSSLLLAELIPLRPDTDPLKENVFSHHSAEAHSLATAIADWIKLKYNQSEKMEPNEWQTVSKALAVAKLLAPDNAEILVLEFQLKQKADIQTPSTLSVAELGSIVYGLVRQVDMKNSTQRSDKTLYAYVLEVAALMDPNNSEIVLAHMQGSGGKNDWNQILSFSDLAPEASMPGQNEVAGNAEEDSSDPQSRDQDENVVPLRNQSKIKILLVTQAASDLWVGSTNNLIATVNPNQQKTLIARFRDKIAEQGKDEDGNSLGRTGEQMNIALDEALRLVRARYSEVKGSIEISFEDKYTSKDGGSLGLASAILLSSVVADFDIDPELAVTGDISADGGVVKVGAIAAKLDGAQDAGSTIAIIPEENLEAITTMLVDNKTEIFKNVQVFSVSSYEQALEIAKLVKSENVRQAIELFDQLKLNGINRSAIEELERILVLAPHHVSAKTLKDLYTGKAPRSYTMRESVNKIMTTGSPFVGILLNEKNQAIRLTERGGFTIPDIPERQIDETQRKLNQLAAKLHPDSSDLHTAVRDLIYAWKDFQERGERSMTSRKSFIDAREEFHEEFDELRLDEDTYQELIRQ